ncbi:MAG: ImmA/IrrE family metallo-endopeptidase [Clostridiales bacterium]|jgi:hypothetical protein|nr:ImmA/IrrE family metallo-endopeptidase [Clostridiales bacterium]
MTKLERLCELAHKRQYAVIDTIQTSLADSLSISEAGSCFIVMNRQALGTEAEKTVAMAHECGHCETGAFYGVGSLLETKGRCERRADKWAAGRLIPAKDLMVAVAAGFTEPHELAVRFGVTERFLRRAVEIYRAKGLLQSD